MSDGDDMLEMLLRIHQLAVSMLREDGEHAPLFFMGKQDGRLESHQFSEVLARPAGPERERELAEYVAGSDARFVIIVSEAWMAQFDELPPGVLPGDAATRREALVVAGIARDGRELLLTTPFRRAPHGDVEIEETEEGGFCATFDEVREVWRAESN
jgi:hypothetical protein